MRQVPPRRHRFQRSVEKLSSIQITPRDVRIMHHISGHRFLRSPEIIALVGGSPQQVLRRLQLLYHHGYLERPRAQIDSYHRAGSQPIAYGLAGRGAAFLRRELNLPFERMQWSRKDDAVGRLFLDHALLISEVMVNLELACRSVDGCRLTSVFEPDFPAPPSRLPFSWRISVPQQKSIRVIPDKVFAIERQNGGMSETIFYFLEADRGTMPIVRSGWDQSSIQRKLMCYAATWQQDVHRQLLGMPRFRVLTVTTSQQRLRSMLDAASQLPSGHGLFLFAVADQFRGHGDPLRFPWTRVDGTTETLLPH